LAETQTLAKIANWIAKQTPDHGSVFDLSAYSEQPGLLQKVSVEDVWGIGPNHARLKL